MAIKVLEYENFLFPRIRKFCFLFHHVCIKSFSILSINLFAESPIKQEASDYQEHRLNYKNELRLSQISLQQNLPLPTSKFKQNDSGLSDERLPVIKKKENYGWLESADYPSLATHVFQSTPGTAQIRALIISILN